MPAPGSPTPGDQWPGSYGPRSTRPGHPGQGNSPAYRAAAHRHRLLQRTRALSLSIAGGAALASLGLGTAFAHAIPGHAKPVGTQNAPATGTGAPAAPAAQSGSAQPSSPGQSAAPARKHQTIAPPPQPPANTPAPPQVSSGGS
ncbi:MAG TPA: hypothetical protein VMV07_07800 [Streptosporangiaceae bacterium]|nr:hypothetical protein [Streptosporangiaceae bacterium]